MKLMEKKETKKKKKVKRFIPMPFIDYLCFYIFINSNSNKKIDEKGRKKIKPHFTIYFWTYLVTLKTCFEDSISKTQFKIWVFLLLSA